MAENVKRINITLPLDEVERLQELVAEGQYPSVSSFVATAVRDRLAERDAHEMLLASLREIGGEPDRAAEEWADQAMRLADEVASGSWHWEEAA
jgi:Arc/MetJ-type ribon-helix-helix transcriptional regulator